MKWVLSFSWIAFVMGIISCSSNNRALYQISDVNVHLMKMNLTEGGAEPIQLSSTDELNCDEDLIVYFEFELKFVQDNTIASRSPYLGWRGTRDSILDFSLELISGDKTARLDISNKLTRFEIKDPFKIIDPNKSNLFIPAEMGGDLPIPILENIDQLVRAINSNHEILKGFWLQAIGVLYKLDSTDVNLCKFQSTGTIETNIRFFDEREIDKSTSFTLLSR